MHCPSHKPCLPFAMFLCPIAKKEAQMFSKVFDCFKQQSKTIACGVEGQAQPCLQMSCGEGPTRAQVALLNNSSFLLKEALCSQHQALSVFSVALCTAPPSLVQPTHSQCCSTKHPTSVDCWREPNHDW